MMEVLRIPDSTLQMNPRKVREMIFIRSTTQEDNVKYLTLREQRQYERSLTSQQAIT